MYNQPIYPGVGYGQTPYYNPQHPGYESSSEIRETEHEEYRPDDAEDAPTSPPPSHAPSLPSTFATPIPSGNTRALMCNCLGRWGYLRLHRPGPFGRDLWFFPTEVRRNGVSGYTWQGGRRRKVSYRYQQISNFMCFA
ncbi:hypothetical protein QUF99_16590 [Bacillus sp. DX4.1]|uniref:hypothetical protein n=1 Tax=Bacillus sp. DX4.1 TaxID=3055867 RepID=UPI0025A122AB|nr:hypothetical protein [Bacillus sp. DX4.1]MDM5188875.1 hypothetical protein [Bacillus sp. DX4.1]